MSEEALYCREQVNHPYPRVRALLLSDPHLVFRRATAAELGPAAELHVQIVDGDVAADVVIEIIGVANDDTFHRPVTTISMEWRTRKSARIQPELNAELRLCAASNAETQLELHGTYHPRASKSGDATERMAEHALAQTSMRWVLQQLAAWLCAQLATSHATEAVAQPPARSVADVDAEC